MHRQRQTWIHHRQYMHVSSCLFIRLIVDSLKQHSAVSWGISLHAPPLSPICLCLLCSVICLSVHSSSSSPPHTHLHQPTLYCLISLSANLPSRICLTFPLSAPSSQSVSPWRTVKTREHLDTAGATALCSSFSPVTSNRYDPRPSTYDKWGCLHCARWWR